MQSTSINFAIPECLDLKYDIGFPTGPLETGLIKPAIEAQAKRKGSMVFNMDCKALSPALDATSGDVDLWGHEIPNLIEFLQKYAEMKAKLDKGPCHKCF